MFFNTVFGQTGATAGGPLELCGTFLVLWTATSASMVWCNTRAGSGCSYGDRGSLLVSVHWKHNNNNSSIIIRIMTLIPIPIAITLKKAMVLNVMIIIIIIIIIFIIIIILIIIIITITAIIS